ncbi:MAG: hypothetical protein M0009_12130 [Deltaproteobacteria bacterium]|nr:hypothetical protein [Deltaproteobacteria bacterium]
MKKALKVFMMVGLGAVILLGKGSLPGGTDRWFGLFSASSAHAGGICFNYTAEKRNAVTTWCRDSQCSSECSGQAAGCLADCQKGCNRFVENLPKGPWLAGQCHLDEDQLDTADTACSASCQTGYPGSVANVKNCQRGCEAYRLGLFQKRGL